MSELCDSPVAVPIDRVFKLAGFADEASDSIDGQIEVTKALGWSSIELRTVDKKQIADIEEQDFCHILSKLKEEGIGICSVGSNIANWAQSINSPFSETKELVKKLTKRTVALGAGLIRIMSFSILRDSNGRICEDQQEKERFRRLSYVVESFRDVGITCVHENCFTYGGLSYEHTLRLLDNVPNLKLVFDTGNPPIDIDIRKGYPYGYQDSFEFYSAVKDYIAHVHIKDSYIGEDGAEHYTFPGEGHGDVEKIVRDLVKSGYNSYFSIEPHMAVVFHNSGVTSPEANRRINYIEYGKRFEAILSGIT